MLQKSKTLDLFTNLTKSDYLIFFSTLIFLSFTATGDTLAIYRFISLAASNPSLNPWDLVANLDPNFSNLSPPPFPYPVGMAALLIPLRWITFHLGEHGLNYSPFGFLLVNLLLSYLFLVTSRLVNQLLIHLNRVKASEPYKYLFLICPAILISVAFQRQLDLFPIFLIVFAIYLAFINKMTPAYTCLMLATLIKTFAIILLPIFVIFFFRKFRAKAILFSLLVILVPILPTILYSSKAYRESVALNSEQLRMFWGYFELGVTWQVILFGPAAVTLMYSLALLKKNFTDFDLVAFSSIALMIPTVVGAPMVTWWSWAAGPLFVAVSYLNPLNRSFQLLNLAFITWTIQFIYSFYYDYSWATQLWAWIKWSSPLSESPYRYLQGHFGITAAELVRNSLFSAQWILQIALISILIRHVFKFEETKNDQ